LDKVDRRTIIYQALTGASDASNPDTKVALIACLADEFFSFADNMEKIAGDVNGFRSALDRIAGFLERYEARLPKPPAAKKPAPVKRKAPAPKPKVRKR
jgi:hypothetical protein